MNFAMVSANSANMVPFILSFHMQKYFKDES